MSAERHSFNIKTNGDTNILDLTQRVTDLIAKGSIKDGIVNIFVKGSTASISTTEYEPGLVDVDLKAASERLAPEHAAYKHEETWNDDNGHAHVRATFIGPSVTIPLIDGKLHLGTWQQIVLLDFDTSPREREITVQVVG